MWKQIPNIPKLEINELGQIRNIKTKKDKSIRNGVNNYQQIVITNNYQKKYYYVHRLVYQTFVGDIPDGKEVNHIDGNPKNNCLNNLELCTHSENCIHRSSLENNHMKKIKVIYKNGEEQIFRSRKDCADYFQVDPSTIRDYMGRKLAKRRKIQAEFFYI